ncbi:DUF6059 family protein [Streptomyces pseudovenezuelae]|uniref:DUF6059 family protein n=1 Tax=Streptomyces pseudovenezuelae TaxID=67350 RepID=UPI0034A201F2
MRRFLRGGRRALGDSFVRRLWLTLVAFGAAHDPYVYANVVGYLEPTGPPPAHPEQLCEDVPLSAQELRILQELWPARYAGHNHPDGR